MQIRAHKDVEHIAHIVDGMVNNPKSDFGYIAKKETAGMTLEIGPSTDEDYNSYQMDAGLSSPLYVDPSLDGEMRYATADAKAAVALAAKGDERAMDAVGFRRVYNPQTKRFDFDWRNAKRGVADAAPDLIGAQLLFPGSVGYITDIFQKPLIWSNATKHVEIYTGTNPWAEAVSQVTGDYSGFAALLAAGDISNNMSNDVEYQAGLMSQAVINASVTYRISIEEQERANNPNSSFPFNGQPIAFKQQYANWALDLIRDVTIYNGVPTAGINGLFQVNGTTSWPYQSLTTIAADGANTNKGQTMYQNLAGVVADFLSTSKNMLSRVRIGMSPEALNQFSIYNYSNVYNPETAIVTFVKNFLAGEGKSGTTPDVEVFSDPLLSANTIFNSAATDYLVISAPEIVGGPNNQNQALIRFAMPLPKFMYPVVPGMQGTPYKTLSRFAGIFAPYTPAVKVYTGFGV